MGELLEKERFEMAGGGMVATGEFRHYEGRVTVYVLLTCLLAACGGLMFGYDVGISGKLSFE